MGTTECIVKEYRRKFMDFTENVLWNKFSSTRMSSEFRTLTLFEPQLK